MARSWKAKPRASVLRVLLVAASMLLALQSSCPPAAAQEQQSTLQKVLARGKVLVAVTTASPPFEFIDKEGKLEGFEIDVARLIAKSLFNKPDAVEFVRTSFDARWTTVNTGRADLGIMVTTIYPPRVLNVAFTEPYFKTGNGCMVRKDSPIKTFADINRPNFSVALLNIAEDHKRHEEFYPKAKALYFGTQSEQYAAVLSGQAQAACTDRPFLAWVVKQHPSELRMLPGTTAGTLNNAIFLKQGDFTWWLYLNTIVNEMRHGSLYPEYDQLYEKWFGEHAPRE